MKKLSLVATTLLLTGTLFASQAHKLSPTQKGILTINFFNTVLKAELKKVISKDHNGTSTMLLCISEADRVMHKINSESPSNVKIRLASPDAQTDPIDTKIIQKYQQDIQAKKAAAMIATKIEVGNTTRVYKPFLIDETWLACHDDKSEVKLGEFKGVVISEVSTH